MKPALTPLDVLHELMKQHDSITAVAQHLDINKGLVSRAVNHAYVSPQLREALGFAPAVTVYPDKGQEVKVTTPAKKRPGKRFACRLTDEQWEQWQVVKEQYGMENRDLVLWALDTLENSLY